MSVAKLTIRELGPLGDGIHQDSRQGPRGRVFVDRAAPGDIIKGNVRRDPQGIHRAEIIEIIKPSPYRQKPPCIHYDRCGNCTLQHLKEGFYRDWKINVVQEALRNERLTPKHWLETVFLAGENRRRATVSATKTRGKLVIGYYRRRSREIVDIDSCLIAEPALFKIREQIRPFLNTLLYDGDKADIFLQLSNNTIDMVMTGPDNMNRARELGFKKLSEDLLVKSAITRISWRMEEGDKIRMVAYKGDVTAKFGQLTVVLPPDAFLQPTIAGERALVDAVMKALPPKGNFADLFSGCGTFTGPMLQRGAVDAYESAPLALKALERAGTRKPLRTFKRDLFRSPLRRDELNRYDAVVFDPPRAGCREQAIPMASAKTPLLIGVSCNPASFARDARILCNGGYRLQSVQIFDQFLWSHHVEVIGIFTKG